MSDQLTPAERSLRARAAALARWGRLSYPDRLAQSAPGRQAAADRFRRLVLSEDPSVTGRDLALRAAALKREHYANAQRAALASRIRKAAR